MMKHILKTDPEVFAASFAGLKGFEIRLNDRDFKVGDELLLKETMSSGDDMKNNAEPLIYTGREATRAIKYILHGNNYGLAEGWVILDLINIDK
tara:strand:+ start:2345 stop:2626 length:282 start_codon:yes stop_codon:yes gene_type:complete